MTVAVSSSDGSGNTVASGTTISNTLLTVASGVTVLIGILWLDVSSGAPTMHWDSTGTNQPMTQVGTVGNGVVNTYLFGLLAPTVGASLSLSASWTGSSAACLSAICFTGTATDTLANAVTNLRTNTGSSTTGSITAAGTTGNINVCAMGAGTVPAWSGLATTSSTAFELINTNIASTAGYAPSAASLAWTASLSSAVAWTAIAVDASAPIAASGWFASLHPSDLIQIWDH